MEKDIENLIEELTKVRPEMLNEEALKLFNTIMAVLDERDKLIEENKKLQECVNKEYQSGYSQGIYDSREAWKETIKEKIEELEECVKCLGNDGMELTYKESAEAQIQVLQELMEDK
mgnify:CR=1 FL=1